LTLNLSIECLDFAPHFRVVQDEHPLINPGEEAHNLAKRNPSLFYRNQLKY
jgi:hypothetical protein